MEFTSSSPSESGGAGDGKLDGQITTKGVKKFNGIQEGRWPLDQDSMDGVRAPAPSRAVCVVVQVVAVGRVLW